MALRRRDLLTGTALALVADPFAGAEALTARIPWVPDAGSPPTPVRPGPWEFFTAQEAATVEALVDRIIPPDPQTPGGKDAGCAVFIDRQLAGGYGHHEGLYNLGPFQHGMVEQGPQSPKGPAETYRAALTALDHYCRSQSGADHGKGFAELPAERQDAILRGLESGSIKLEGVDAQAYFNLLIKDTQQGFFADPIYGGNRNMCSWKMIGFPGARYDYRDWVERHNERYPYPPVSIAGRPDWTPAKS